MLLSEFVSQTLVEIMKGVVNAQKAWTDLDEKGHINPAYGGYEVAKEGSREVSFDVAVTVSEEKAGGAQGGIKVLGIADLGGEASASKSNSTVSRVAFSIPIAPPMIFVQLEGSPFQPS